jgi:hypothetical protein
LNRLAVAILFVCVYSLWLVYLCALTQR